MTGFCRNALGQAMLAGTPLADLLGAAGTGTPAFVYDLDAIRAEVRGLEEAFGPRPHLVAYAVKANSAGSILRTIAEEGAGADVVSRGELELALKCGFPPDRIVMSGVAKRDDEIDCALENGILALQLESAEEVERVAARAAALGLPARISLRINPGVAIDSHAHVATGHEDAKFGISRASLSDALVRADRRGLHVVGLSVHVGSMITEVLHYISAVRAVCEAARDRAAAGRSVEFVDFGGGFGIDYGEKPSARPADFVRAALAEMERTALDVAVVVEPGRSVVGPHGVLVASVIQTKVSNGRRWCFVDAAMNDLIRPALYGARHRVEPIDRAPSPPEWRVAGPVCESADVFGSFALGEVPPEMVVFRDAGAYGFVMASEYNGRPLAAEVFAASGRVVSVSQSPGRQAWIERRVRA